MSESWYDLVPNSGKEREDDPDITDTGIFSEILPAVGELFKLLAPYRREKPLVRNSDGDEAPGTSQCCEREEKSTKPEEASNDNEEPSTSKTDITAPQIANSNANEEDDDSSSSDDEISTSSESSSTSDSEVEDINFVSGFTKLDLDGMLKSTCQRVNLRKLFKPGEYEALCRFEQKRIIRIENKLTLMLRLKLPLPNENILREKIGLPRLDIAQPESSDTESDDGWESRRKNSSSGQPVLRGISDEDTAARMAFITKYCEDRQSGKRVVQELPKKKFVKPTKIRRIAKEKKACFETFKKAAEALNGSGDGPSKDEAARYNTRKNTNAKYQEDYVPENDHFVYCEDCKKLYIDDCPEHPLTIMKDSDAELGVENYAKRTCPPGLSIDPSSVRNAGYGVWADVAIPKNTVFGPYKGEIIKKYDVKKLTKVCNGGYSWEIYEHDKLYHYVDGSDPTVSNWMRYVNCARFVEEQNLVAFQYRGQIYYRAFSDIKNDTEMFVWYGAHYASQLGIREKLRSKQPQQTQLLLSPSSTEFQDRNATTDETKPPQNFRNREHCESLSDSHRIQPSSESYWTCSICHEKFAFKLNLLHHVDYRHKRIKRFQCKACGRTFSSYNDLKRHLRTHTGEKPYKCDRCGERFNRKGNLRIHERIHTGEKPYKCDRCGERFSQKGSLRIHERIHTGEKPYKCDRCGERFNQNSNLRIHERIHTGEKPYKCDQCGERFNHKGNLRKHERIHTGEKPYKCDECEKRFRISSTRRRHQKRCHT